jgi:glycosyltransferase involved in cell wall biosynthesis
MNILILLETLWPFGSGGELATYLYLSELTKAGFNLSIAMPTFSVDRSVSKYSFSIVYFPRLGYGKHSLYLSKSLLKSLFSKVDLVYLASCCWNLIPFAKALGRPVVVHIHSYDPVCPVGSLYNFIEGATCSPERRLCPRCIYEYERSHFRPLWRVVASTLLNGLLGRRFVEYLQYADALIFVSEAQRRLFLKHLRELLDGYIPRSYVIYNPVPEVGYSPPREFNVGYFGGLSPLKGFHVLLKSWVRIRRRHREVKLYATKMGELAGSNVLERLNVYAYGRLDLRSLEELYSKVGVVVFPSIWQEPLPYVVIESMLRGRILIASRVGGIPEIVDGAPGVRLVPPEDADSLTDALDWTLSMDRRDFIELGLKNREYALKRFDNERSARMLIKVFESVSSQA